MDPSKEEANAWQDAQVVGAESLRLALEILEDDFGIKEGAFTNHPQLVAALITAIAQDFTSNYRKYRRED